MRAALVDQPTWSRVLVACSGGADSLALAAATAFEAPRAGLRAGAVIVDHGLQEGSARVAARAAEQCRTVGLEPVDVVRVQVLPSPTGPEDSARTARYAALADAATRHTAAVILLGHTRDDQAEQVLLGLARGSGARSLSGMPPARGPFLRPLLGVSRSQTEAACAEAGLTPWNDPHNHDLRFARARARRALATLEEALGPGLSAALARSAELLRDDADLLDQLAARARAEVGPAEVRPAEVRQTEVRPAEVRPAEVGPAEVGPAEPGPRGWVSGDGGGDVTVDALALGELEPALRRRVWRLLAAEAGAGGLTATQVSMVDALVSRWRGQGPVDLPGGVVARRVGRIVHLAPRTINLAPQTKPVVHEK